MIVADRKQKETIDKFNRFGEAMKDGRWISLSNRKVYRLREAILLSKRLGRSLTQEEMKQFEAE